MRDVSNIEIRQLRHFVVVAEELHFRRAAARLGMTQPPLSQSIARLEGELGLELFDRTRRQIRLTEAGGAFLEAARLVLDNLAQAVSAAQRAARGHIGRIRIAYVGAAGYALLPRLVAAYRTSYPDVEIEMSERTAAGQLKALESGEADVGLIRMPVLGAAGLRLETIHREPFMVALPAGHRLATQSSISLGELASEQFVMFPAREAPAFHAQIVGACMEAGFAMQIAQESLQMHAIVSLVAAGLGIALVPAALRHLQQPEVVYLPCEGAPDGFEAQLALAWRRGEPSSTVTSFLETARRVGSQAGFN